MQNGKRVYRLIRKNEKYTRKGDENFPLRSHLKCSICGRNLTGSKCRSRSGEIYFYYHCQDTCKERYRVDHAHESLKKYLKSLTIKPEVKKAYMVFMQQVFNQKEGTRENEARILQAKIQRTKDLINAAEDKFLQDLIDGATYKRVKARYEAEIATLEQELKNLKDSETGYMKYLREALSLLENLDYHYENARWEERQKLLKILFPEKLIYKNKTFIYPGKDGISLLVSDIKEFEKDGASGQTGSADMKVLKLGRVG